VLDGRSITMCRLGRRHHLAGVLLTRRAHRRKRSRTGRRMGQRGARGTYLRRDLDGAIARLTARPRTQGHSAPFFDRRVQTPVASRLFPLPRFSSRSSCCRLLRPPPELQPAGGCAELACRPARSHELSPALAAAPLPPNPIGV
jgi:hypothetical protein